MVKFVRIKNHLINIDKVYDFELCDHTIFVSYSGCESDMCIEFANKQEAALVFEDIPHLIDNNYIPNHVREQRLNELKWKAHQAEARAVINAMDASNWDELPF
jgi:hypothetical protein